MAKARHHLIAGNWKMNGTCADLRDWFVQLEKAQQGVALAADLLLCPPATLLCLAAELSATVRLAIGGQDCHRENAGAHTGDLSAGLLRDAGARFVLLGHSERRQAHGEANTTIAHKMTAALAAGLVPIICVGETADERRQGRTLAVLREQITALAKLEAAQDLVIAYEPRWAIGSGQTATANEITPAHEHLRALLNLVFGSHRGERTRILYGGSVTRHNAMELSACCGVDGFLVGGASLSAAHFWDIACVFPQ